MPSINLTNFENEKRADVAHTISNEINVVQAERTTTRKTTRQKEYHHIETKSIYAKIECQCQFTDIKT